MGSLGGGFKQQDTNSMQERRWHNFFSFVGMAGALA